MASKVSKLTIGVVLTVLLLLGVLQVVLSYSEIGITSQIGTGGYPLLVSDHPDVSQWVAEDATKLATELYGDYQEKCNDFVSQLLAIYEAAKDKDFILIFNPGGWGWASVEASLGWWSLFGGIKSELDSSGYASLLLDYRRTAGTLRGCLDEFVAMIVSYPTKAKDLAFRVKFLTTHIPDLRVIVTGESNGTVIADRVMSILGDNPQVYSIQTGSPFWHKNIILDRTLVITDNGIIPDSFSQGDFLTIISASLKDLFGFPRAEDDYGKILFFARAPGHDYRWQYPEVYSQIADFLDKNFGIK